MQKEPEWAQKMKTVEKSWQTGRFYTIPADSDDPIATALSVPEKAKAGRAREACAEDNTYPTQDMHRIPMTVPATPTRRIPIKKDDL